MWTDICYAGGSADNIRRGFVVHLYTTSEMVSQCIVGSVSLCSRPLASH